MPGFDTDRNPANFSTEVEEEWIGKESKGEWGGEMKGGETESCVCYVK